LEEKEAHVILYEHLLDDEVYIGVEASHKFIYLDELSLYSLDQHMSQILVVIRK
jgi:hypothetical protein